MGAPLVKLQHIYKSYGDIQALTDVSIEIHSSNVIGFIGADGAGKSTLMKIMLTLEKMDSGEGSIFGLDVSQSRSEIRSRIGYMPEMFSLYQDLSVQENLNFFFKIYKLPSSRYEEKMQWLYRFNRLEKFKNTLAGNLSGGMKQKLALSCALMNDPDLLVLDEPTTGVDPVSRSEFWKMLHTLKQAGKGIVISTPYLDEAMSCDYIYLFHKGRILQEGHPGDIIQQFPVQFYSLKAQEPYRVLHQIKSLFPSLKAYLIGDEIHVAYSDLEKDFDIDRLNQFGTLKPITPNLEDIFLHLLQKESKEQNNHE